MPDGKQACASCPHPFAEHAESGCKVPGCSCVGFVGEHPVEGHDDAPIARHTLIGRATDADGIQGIELKLPNGEGNPLGVDEGVIQRFGEDVQEHYRQIFGTVPRHIGVTAVPYLASADAPVSQDGVPMLMVGEEADPAEVVEMLKTIDSVGFSVEGMPHHQQLAYYLKDISAEDAAKAIKGSYLDADAQEALATKLGQMDDEKAYMLAARLRNGDFNVDA